MQSVECTSCDFSICGASFARGALVSGASKRRRVIGQLPDDLRDYVGKLCRSGTAAGASSM
eukprot:3030180-Pyramimonas_sp.AAC.1